MKERVNKSRNLIALKSIELRNQQYHEFNETTKKKILFTGLESYIFYYPGRLFKLVTLETISSSSVGIRVNHQRHRAASYRFFGCLQHRVDSKWIHLSLNAFLPLNPNMTSDSDSQIILPRVQTYSHSHWSTIVIYWINDFSWPMTTHNPVRKQSILASPLYERELPLNWRCLWRHARVFTNLNTMWISKVQC